MHKFRSRVVVFFPFAFWSFRFASGFRATSGWPILRFGRPYILITLLRPFGSNYFGDLVFVPGSIRLPRVAEPSCTPLSPLVLGVALIVLKCV